MEQLLIAQLLREFAKLGVSDLTVAVAIDPKAHCGQLCKRERDREKETTEDTDKDRERQRETDRDRRGGETVHLWQRRSMPPLAS